MNETANLVPTGKSFGRQYGSELHSGDYLQGTESLFKSVFNCFRCFSSRCEHIQILDVSRLRQCVMPIWTIWSPWGEHVQTLWWSPLDNFIDSAYSNQQFDDSLRSRYETARSLTGRALESISDHNRS